MLRKLLEMKLKFMHLQVLLSRSNGILDTGDPRGGVSSSINTAVESLQVLFPKFARLFILEVVVVS